MYRRLATIGKTACRFVFITLQRLVLDSIAWFHLVRIPNCHECRPKAEPGAAVCQFFRVLLIWRSICWPLKSKLIAFSGHILLSRVPPPCIAMSDEKWNFLGRPESQSFSASASPQRGTDVECTAEDIRLSHIYNSIQCTASIHSEVVEQKVTLSKISNYVCTLFEHKRGETEYCIMSTFCPFQSLKNRG